MSARNPLALAGHEAGEMELDDSVLWARSADGDTDAFALLFERHAKEIYNYCFRRVGDWSSAEDLLWSCSSKRGAAVTSQLPPGKVLPWLYGIATNVVRNRRRSERRYRAALARMPAPEAEPSFDAEGRRGSTTSAGCDARWSSSPRYRESTRTC